MNNQFSRTVPMKWFTLSVLILLIGVNILSSFFFARFDVTREGQYSISKATKNLLGKLEDTVTIKAYITADLPPQFLPVKQYLSDLLSEYQAYGRGSIAVQFVDPLSDETIKKEAAEIGVQEVRMQVIEKDSLAVRQGYLGLGIFYKDKKEGIPLLTMEQLGTFEYDLSSLILKMTSAKIPLIGFLQGHGEPELGDVFSAPAQGGSPYSILAQILRKTYRVIPVSLGDGISLDPVDVLVVAGPRRDLPARDVFEIDQYLLKGGKAIFLLDGVDQKEQQLELEPVTSNVLTMLAPLGVTVKKNLVLDQQSDFGQFSEGPGRIFILPYPPFVRLSSENGAPHAVTSKLKSFVLRFVSELAVQEQEGITLIPFVRTTYSAWTQEPPFLLNPNEIPVPSADQKSQKVIGIELRGTFPRLSDANAAPPRQRWKENKKGEWVLELGEKEDSKKKAPVLKIAEAEGRVMVLSDSDLVTNQSLQGGDEAGLTLFLNMVDSLALGDDLVGIRAKALSGAKLGQLDDTKRSLMKVLGIALMPVVLSVYGVVRLWMRRRS